MQKIIVKNIDDKPTIIIPENTIVTEWMTRVYGIVGEYTKEETHIPARECIVTITKPKQVRTPRGIMTTTESSNETWYYFDMPMKSILVADGDDISEEVGLEIYQPKAIDEEKIDK